MSGFHHFEPNGDPDLEADLDEEFPLGDGTVDTEATVICPHCAEVVAIGLDPGSGTVQEYIEDCAVCCQPWTVLVSYKNGAADVSVRALE
ncbi:MAG TPA: CPXCG motif-containing cysteine-rich protein [Gemmatimonadaceae bacterium]|nr:CPXCG motif-containing cysteine-rich protein [Gemmatimonadaceae bacterium]